MTSHGALGMMISCKELNTTLNRLPGPGQMTIIPKPEFKGHVERIFPY